VNQLSLKDVWLDLRIRNRGTFVEVYEHRPGDTTLFLIIVLVPGTLFLLAYGLSVGIDGLGLLFALLIVAITAIIASVPYKLPRSIRLYPVEQLAETSYRLYAIRFLKRWTDMSTHDYAFHPVGVMAYDEEESNPEVVIGCLFAFVGPLGLAVAPIARRLFRKKVSSSAYALESDESSARPLLVVKTEREVQRILYLSRTVMSAE